MFVADAEWERLVRDVRKTVLVRQRSMGCPRRELHAVDRERIMALHQGAHSLIRFPRLPAECANETETDMLDHEAIAARHSELLSRMLGRECRSNAYKSFDGDEGQSLLIDADGYHWVSYERGQENGRTSTQNVEELLFWFLEQAASSIGCAHEFANRIAGPDFRRMVHARQRELFARLGPEWSARLERRIAATLAEHPYLDE